MDEAGRRAFLKKCIWLGTAIVGSVATLPLLGSVLDPTVRGTRSRRRFVRVASLDSLPVGEPRKLAVLGDRTDAWIREERRRIGAVWLVRGADDRVRAFSAICPHLGCSVDLDARGRRFACPCHQSAFRLDGARLSGPSARGLDSLDTHIQQGEVLVRFVRFRQGVARKVEIG